MLYKQRVQKLRFQLSWNINHLNPIEFEIEDGVFETNRNTIFESFFKPCLTLKQQLWYKSGIWHYAWTASEKIDSQVSE